MNTIPAHHPPQHPLCHSLKTLLLILAAGLLTACSTLVTTPGAAADAAQTQDVSPALNAEQAQQAWARVLAMHVNERGLVNFAALARAPQDLHAYVRYVAWLKPESLPTAQAQLAHHINAYNALSMFNVIDLGIPQSNASLISRYRFFIGRKHLIAGQYLSLYDYENKIIRKLGEPRIHWALNCSALSCPVLPREPFEAARLQEQLERESRKFFSEVRNLHVDQATRTVHLSEIFSFFPEDFAPPPEPISNARLIDYANRYSPTPLDSSYTLRFIPYDWTIANWQ
jgi:hypothetical protein